MKTIIEMAREAGFEINHNMILVGEWEISPYMQRFAAIVRAEAQAEEREAIYAEWHSCVMSDLENGVKWLNEKLLLIGIKLPSAEQTVSSMD